MKFNKTQKIGFLTIIALLVVGLVMLITLNFNLGYDFKGGNVLTVNTTTYQTSEAYTKVQKILSDNDLGIYSMAEGENVNGTCIVVKYEITDTETNQTIKAAVFSSFGYDSADIMDSKYVSLSENTTPQYSAAVFLNALLVVLISLISLAIYMFFRANIVTGFTLLASGIMSIALMLAIMAIVRVPVNAGVGYAIIATLIISVVLNFILLNLMNRTAQDEAHSSRANKEIAENAVNKLLDIKHHLIIIGFLVFLLILLAVCGGALAFGIYLSTIIGLIASVAVSYFLTPALWSIAYTRKVRAPKKKLKTDEEVEIVAERDIQEESTQKSEKDTIEVQDEREKIAD